MSVGGTIGFVQRPPNTTSTTSFRARTWYPAELKLPNPNLFHPPANQYKICSSEPVSTVALWFYNLTNLFTLTPQLLLRHPLLGNPPADARFQTYILSWVS